jgi:nitrite reductase (NO-forming)
MDFKPGPAKLSAERHTGPFAAGSALSMDAALKPLVPDTVKEVRLDTTHKVIEIAPGVKFSAWTFGDQVPGPVVRVRVGDRVKFSMTNRSDEPAPGLQVMAAPMMHSMDFHAAMVSPQDKYRSIAPGQTISFEFTANYPGIFMYHCGTPMVLEHIASGMYGMVIVEPRSGYPTKVDREYTVKVRGVQAGTLRTSLAPPAFSFVLDSTQTPQAAVAGFRKSVADSTARLTLVQIMRDGVLQQAN